MGKIDTNGKYINLGTANNLLYEIANKDLFSFSLKLKNGELKFYANIDKDNPYHR